MMLFDVCFGVTIWGLFMVAGWCIVSYFEIVREIRIDKQGDEYDGGVILNAEESCEVFEKLEKIGEKIEISWS